MNAALPEAVRVAKMPIEIWHQDGARVGQHGTLTYVWAEKGSRPEALRDLRYEWAKLAQGSAGAAGGIASQGYLFGAVCAECCVGAALVLPHANTKAMNLHLVEISRNVAAGAHALVVLDGAGWHQTGGRLRVPANISLLHLPPYLPELNPVENVWEYLREN